MSNSCFPIRTAISHLRSLAAVTCVLATAASSYAADAQVYHASAVGSKVTIDGKANIHDWTMVGTIITGTFEVPAGVELDPSKAGLAGVTGGKLAAKVDAKIPVSSIRDIGGWTGMDNTMLQAMKADQFPRITFNLTEMTLKEPHAAGTPLQFDAKGDLQVAGVTNKIAMPVSITAADQGKLKVTGSVPLKMTSFNITPPRTAGLFTTVDDVVISIEWTLKPPAAAKPAAP